MRSSMPMKPAFAEGNGPRADAPAGGRVSAGRAETGRSGKAPADLAIVSAYPPPYGGVSVEVQRLMPLLDKRGVRYVIYNAGSRSGDGVGVVPVSGWRGTWLVRYMLTGKEPAIYLMSGRLAAWVLGAMTARLRRKRILVQLRNAALPDWIARSWWRRALAGFALRRMNRVVCVSRRLVDAARSVGVHPGRIHWSPAFLPPELAPEDRANVAAEVWAFAESHRPLIAANGKVAWYLGQDLYGLDMLVDLSARLKGDHPRLGIVVCFWDHKPDDEPYLKSLRRMADERGVADRILFNTRSGAFVPVLQASDLLVRPTNTDGDAVSVREGLYLGKPVVASDAVERPVGVRVFRSRDAADLEAKVREVLRSRSDGSAQPAPGLSLEDRGRIQAYVELLASVAKGAIEVQQVKGA